MIIAIANQKGGVGKTITAVTLAHGAALAGRSVLLVDLDSQGNVADSLGLEPGGDLADWLTSGKDNSLTGRNNLQVMRSDKTTAACKTVLSGQDFREYCISNQLDGYHQDLVILDFPPSVDLLHTAGLVAADYLVIPTRLDQFAIKGVTEVLRSLQAVQRAKVSHCKVLSILPTFYDRVTGESQAQLENLVRGFGGLVWEPVPVDNRIRVANRMGLTLWELDKPGRSLPAYRAALEKILKLED